MKTTGLKSTDPDSHPWKNPIAWPFNQINYCHFYHSLFLQLVRPPALMTPSPGPWNSMVSTILIFVYIWKYIGTVFHGVNMCYSFISVFFCIRIKPDRRIQIISNSLDPDTKKRLGKNIYIFFLIRIPKSPQSVFLKCRSETLK